jgi:molybdopterin-guanine dinucleotide biosynthesis protein A
MVDDGAVLAGGRSTRMGREKALIPIDGVPLALRTATILKRCGISTISLVGRQRSLQQLGLPIVSEPAVEHHHPLYGVAAILQKCAGPLVLVVPCDVVNLTEAHVQALLATGGPCVASSAGVTHPLMAILPVELAAQARTLADEGKSAHTLVQGLPVVELPEPTLNDANSPEQLPR